MVEGRMHATTLPDQHDNAYKLAHGAHERDLPQSPEIKVGGHGGGPANAHVPAQFSPLTNPSLLFNNQGLRNAEPMSQVRHALADGLGSPGGLGTDMSRAEGGTGLVASASVDRRASEVAASRFRHADISGGVGEISPDGKGGTHASALEPGERHQSTHFSRPPHAHSATKRSGHFKLNPLVAESNRTSHVEGLRVSGLEGARPPEGHVIVGE